MPLTADKGGRDPAHLFGGQPLRLFQPPVHIDHVDPRPQSEKAKAELRHAHGVLCLTSSIHCGNGGQHRQSISRIPYGGTHTARRRGAVLCGRLAGELRHEELLVLSETLILDGVVILRTYVVRGSKLIVILPILGYCGLTAATIGFKHRVGYGLFARDQHLHCADGQVVYGRLLSDSENKPLRDSIWQVTRKSSRYRSGTDGGPLGPVRRAIIESGAICPMAIIAGLITSVVQSNGVYIFLDIVRMHAAVYSH
ncbi:hypothetical protein NUW54_g8303 [Trametes sanguinea]|uniref:Uncharacterized protein n=1 Tax=Trametes sanguinea TaxID=158606 RepID=A0ACC1PEG6_9APHY|nr:hypothetical protein NUW54_g8303 [Trametes sanguinea]